MADPAGRPAPHEMTISAKDIRLMPIASRDANPLIQRLHYSGTYTRNAQLHLGAFIGDQCHGVMSFGPPMDKSKVLPLWTALPLQAALKRSAWI
ncbi:Mom family adenine methylcarbamoylation protein, partial [Sphingobium yanoikuyae]|uniref:Mom family adenine methylcarbamoylation protein n=1 Tax=Sphingobium yanoikuyae TaxID=13690 RepID=UPI00289B6F73